MTAQSGPVQFLADMVIMLLGLATLAYAIQRGAGARRLYPTGGRLLLAVGTALFAVAYLVHGIATVILPELFGVPVPNALSVLMPGWLHWGLTRTSALLVLLGLCVGTRHRRRLERVVSSKDHLIRDAFESVAHSEQRFRHLLETTSNSIFCYVFDPPLPISLPLEEQIRRSHDAVLTECNSVFARAIDPERPDSVIGTKMGMLDGNRDSVAHRQYWQAFVDSDYRLTNYDLIYQTPDGDDRAVRSSLSGIIEKGQLHRFWGAETNILDIRHTKAALLRRQRYQELLGTISSRLVTAPLEKANEVIEQSMLELCHYVGADRTALMWYDPASKHVDLAHSYTRAGARFEAPVSLASFPQSTALLQQNSVVRVDDFDNPPADVAGDRQALLDRNIKSLLALPLAVDSEVVGVSSYVYTVEKHRWTDQEVTDLRVFAELFATFMMRVKSRRELDEALQGLRRATDRLEAENVYLRQEIKLEHQFDEIIGNSEPILRCLRKVEQVAATTTPVLVLGETGTGKELIARAIHEHSDRKHRPLVKVNCAALPASLIESELFGYEKGAFTGASASKRGRFDLADGSTLFLDEIGDIPLELQAKLLRALQEGEIERLGGVAPITVDVRIIAATNRDLGEAVQAGEFRSDLYYRINTFPIELPPLRDRSDDIDLLARHFVKLHSPTLGRKARAMSAGMLRSLREYAWPGNIRELDSVIQRAIITSTGNILELAEPLVKPERQLRAGEPHIISSTIANLDLVEREHILWVLDQTSWKISGTDGAASKLGMPPSTLRSKMKKLSISRPG